MSEYINESLLDASPIKKQKDESAKLVTKWEKSGLLAYSPLACGYLSGKYRNNKMPKNSRLSLFKGWERMINPLAMKAYDEYYKLAKEYNMTMVQLAQAFVNSRPFVTSNIIGATSMDLLKDNIDSINHTLGEEILVPEAKGYAQVTASCVTDPLLKNDQYLDTKN